MVFKKNNNQFSSNIIKEIIIIDNIKKINNISFKKEKNNVIFNNSVKILFEENKDDDYFDFNKKEYVINTKEVYENSILFFYESKLSKAFDETKKYYNNIIIDIDETYDFLSKKLLINKIIDFNSFFELTIKSFLKKGRVFDYYKKKDNKKEKNNSVNIIIVAKKEKELNNNLKRIIIESNNINYLRDLVDLTPQDANISFLTKEAKKLKDKKTIIKVLDYDNLKKESFNGLINVGKGSKEKPRMIIIDYNYNLKEKPIVLVGKGIIFDTGGYNLKLNNGMYDMKTDMAGAATIIALIKNLKEQNIKKRVVGILCLAENKISEDAYRPYDIIRYKNNINVEVLNTDAEGRLVLADGLIKAEDYNPRLTISIATLTGAAMLITGRSAAPIMGVDKESIKELLFISRITNERLWELPLFEEQQETLKSKIADINNLGEKNPYGINEGSCMIGAYFLSYFRKSPWVHIDIAGVASTHKPFGSIDYGATGFGVSLLTRWLKEKK